MPITYKPQSFQGACTVDDGFRSGLDFSSNATRNLGWLGGVRMDQRGGEPATHRATEPRPEPWRVCYPGESDRARSAHTSPGCSGEREERRAAAVGMRHGRATWGMNGA